MTDKPTLEERANEIASGTHNVDCSDTDEHDCPLYRDTLAALRDAVAERDREWSDTLWPENPEGAGPCEPSEAGAQIKALVAYAVAEERKALREIANRNTFTRRSGEPPIIDPSRFLAALDAREKRTE